MKNLEPNASWLHGKYENGEINTNLPYVAVNDPDFFAQGNDAENIINEIHQIWIVGGSGYGNLTTEQAFNQWINLNL